jgi:hypothetical protein
MLRATFNRTAMTTGFIPLVRILAKNRRPKEHSLPYCNQAWTRAFLLLVFFVSASSYQTYLFLTRPKHVAFLLYLGIPFLFASSAS